MSRAKRKAERAAHRDAVNAYYRQNGMLPAEPEQQPTAPPMELFSDEWYALLPPGVADIIRDLKEHKGDPREKREDRDESHRRTDQPTDHMH